MRLIFSILLAGILLYLPPAVMAERVEYEEYTIKKGDTLWDITGGRINDPFFWPMVWKENPHIKNPDLIYPGQRIRIPLFMIQKQIDVAPPAEEKVALPEEPTVRGKAVAIAPRHPFIIKGDLIAASGYIEKDMPHIGRVASTPSGRTLIGQHDEAYIELFDRTRPENGNKFYTIRSYGMVEHPGTGTDIGYLIEITGVVEVTGEEAGYTKTKVIKSFSEIHTGDYLDSYFPIESFPLIRGTTPLVKGTVVASRDLRVLNGLYDIVYLDRGSSDGIVPGNTFTLISGKEPNRPIATIQVISTRQQTSAAIIIKEEVEVSRGDYF